MDSLRVRHRGSSQRLCARPTRANERGVFWRKHLELGERHLEGFHSRFGILLRLVEPARGEIEQPVAQLVELEFDFLQRGHLRDLSALVFDGVRPFRAVVECDAEGDG